MDIKKLKETVLPYFIKKYGECYEDIITRRMEKTEVIFYDTLEFRKTELRKMENDYQNKLLLEFLESNNFDFSDDDKKKFVLNKSNYINENKDVALFLDICFNSNTINEYSTFVKTDDWNLDDSKYNNKNKVKIFNYFGADIDSDSYSEFLNSDIGIKTLDKILDIKEKIGVLINKNKKFKEENIQYKELSDIVNKGILLENTIKRKNYFEFVNEFSYMFNEMDLTMLKNKDNRSGYEQFGFYNLFGRSLRDDVTLNCFLVDDYSNKSEFAVKKIKEDKIKFYKYIGVYKDGQDIDEFLLSDDAIDNEPSKEFINLVISKKNEYLKKEKLEILECTSTYKENKEYVDSLGILDNCDFELEDIKEKYIYSNMAMVEVDGDKDILPVVFYSKGATINGYADISFIHELVHCIEGSLVEEGVYKSGYEILTGEKDEDASKSTVARPYTSISEAVTQLIAMEITEEMHNDGIYLFEDKDISKIRHATSYERSIMFIKDFFNEFREDNYEARLFNKMDYLFSRVGEDNFNELNNIVNEDVEKNCGIYDRDILLKNRKESFEKSKEVLNAMLMNSSLDNSNNSIDVKGESKQ